MIAIIGDMHWGIKGGNNDFLEFQKFWLEDALKKIEAMGITTIIQTGDMFDTRQHIKLNVLHEIIHWFPQILKKYGITQWIAYGGNHDMFYRDNNAICSLDLLNLLSDKELNFHIIKDEVEVLLISGKTKAAFVPWINKENSDRLLSKLTSSKVDYVFGHFELVGMPMIPGFLCEHGIEPKQFKQFKRVISGHFHTISESLNCTMVGTPYHLTWGDVQDGTNRGFWTLDTDTDEFVLHKNEEHMTLFSVIEYDPTSKYTDAHFSAYKGTIAKVLVKEKPDAKHFKKFSDILAKAGFIDYKVIDTTMVQVEKVEISETTLSLDTLSAMNAFIDGQGDDFNKDGVKKLAKTVYLETINGGQ